MCRGDELVHPPVGALGQQVDEGLQETHTQILQILWRLHLLGVGKEHVLLQGDGKRKDGTVRLPAFLSHHDAIAIKCKVFA